MDLFPGSSYAACMQLSSRPVLYTADGSLPSHFLFLYHMHTSPCRHILFTPQSYHVASTESFSFTSYSTERFEVTATLSYDQCSCTNRRRSCNNNGNVLSSAAGTTRFGVYDCHVIAAHSCSNLYFCSALSRGNLLSV